MARDLNEFTKANITAWTMREFDVVHILQQGAEEERIQQCFMVNMRLDHSFCPLSSTLLFNTTFMQSLVHFILGHDTLCA